MERIESALDPTMNISMAHKVFQVLIKVMPSSLTLGITHGARHNVGINQRQNERPIGGVSSKIPRPITIPIDHASTVPVAIK